MVIFYTIQGIFLKSSKYKLTSKLADAFAKEEKNKRVRLPELFLAYNFSVTSDREIIQLFVRQLCYR